MGKHLIIDGYNLLGARGKIGGQGAQTHEFLREELLQELAQYRIRTRHAVTVVFDGWQQGMGTEHHEHRAGVEVIFSRKGEPADQVIQRLADEYRTDCAVVSSDREVSDYAKKMGAFVMRADEFDRQIRQATGGIRGKSLRKDIGEKDETDLPRRREKKGNPKKLPKSVRKRQRQLKSF